MHFLSSLPQQHVHFPALPNLALANTDTAEPSNTPESVLPNRDGSPTDATEEVTRISVLVPDEVIREDALVNIYQTVSPGVVSIQVYTQSGAGQGSGFIVDKEGHIVTNYHVVEDAATIEVHFQSGLKVYAEVVGVDLDSDIAVVKVDVDPEELFPLTIVIQTRFLLARPLQPLGILMA